MEGSWPDLFQIMIDGEIDLMSDVSYTDERSELMLFSELPMGAEAMEMIPFCPNRCSPTP